MKIALIYDRGRRVGIGERCQDVLQRMPGIEFGYGAIFQTLGWLT